MNRKTLLVFALLMAGVELPPPPPRRVEPDPDPQPEPEPIEEDPS